MLAATLEDASSASSQRARNSWLNSVHRSFREGDSGVLKLDTVGELFVSMAHARPAVEACASLSFCEHSSQHTSTALPPILTVIAFPSSLQSQAAQVFSTMTSL